MDRLPIPFPNGFLLLAGIFALSVGLAGCSASSVVPLGTSSFDTVDELEDETQEIPSDSVAVYTDSTDFACSYTKVALLTIETKESTESMIDNARDEAAEIGANALLLHGSGESFGIRPERAEATAVREDRPCTEEE